jgi:predicted HicB family RNase H-like nuclease
MDNDSRRPGPPHQSPAGPATEVLNIKIPRAVKDYAIQRARAEGKSLARWIISRIEREMRL